MQIFHIAELAHWDAAQATGSYTRSTFGRSLDEEGFIHAARADQWADVRRRYYADVHEPLVLLVIDTDRLGSPWQEEVVGDATYPHIHGPLNVDAVVATVPLDDGESPATPAPTAAPDGEARPGSSFLHEFLREMTFRMLLGTSVMVFALACGVLGEALGGDIAALSGLLLGIAVGSAVAVVVGLRRMARLSR